MSRAMSPERTNENVGGTAGSVFRENQTDLLSTFRHCHYDLLKTNPPALNPEFLSSAPPTASAAAANSAAAVAAACRRPPHERETGGGSSSAACFDAERGMLPGGRDAAATATNPFDGSCVVGLPPVSGNNNPFETDGKNDSATGGDCGGSGARPASPGSPCSPTAFAPPAPVAENEAVTKTGTDHGDDDDDSTIPWLSHEASSSSSIFHDTGRGGDDDASTLSSATSSSRPMPSSYFPNTAGSTQQPPPQQWRKQPQRGSLRWSEISVGTRAALGETHRSLRKKMEKGSRKIARSAEDLKIANELTVRAVKDSGRRILRSAKASLRTTK
mmetsp:Transcript_25676/g.56488  ORF Transcript_25676/g.56488 Transcript_25676/m.56488 type:complete len:330 (+) Transcript_25676:806-1795(+)